MLNRYYKQIAILSLLILLTNGCQSVYRSGLVPIPPQKIAGEIEIGGDWVEIVPPQILIPYGDKSRIDLGYRNYTRYIGVIEKYKDADASPPGEFLYFPDGRRTRVEAILYDDQGESYELKISSLCGIELESSNLNCDIGLSRKPITQTDDGRPAYIIPDFPTDRTFTKLRMRSQVPLKLKHITWQNSVGSF